MSQPLETRRFLLPWRLPALPRWVEVVPGLVYLLSAILKFFSPLTLCGPSPWEPANAALLPVEIVLGIVLLLPRAVPAPPDLAPDHLLALAAARRSRVRADRRRLGGLLGALLSLGALGVLSFLHFFGRELQLEGADTGSCGCFGPVELPYPAHVAVLLVLAGTLGAVFLHEETVLAGEGGEPPPQGS